jgi:hypothetical protein
MTVSCTVAYHSLLNPESYCINLLENGLKTTA